MKYKLAAVLFLIVVGVVKCRAEMIDVERMADAIFLAEGGDKARVPYGVLSVKVRDKSHARSITIISIRNNIKRWNKAGKPGTFVEFMANRWCPESSDAIGNKNWKRNVTLIYSKSRNMPAIAPRFDLPRLGVIPLQCCKTNKQTQSLTLKKGKESLWSGEPARRMAIR